MSARHDAIDRLRVSQRDSEAGSWRVVSLAPGGLLPPYVTTFYAYDESGTSFRRRRELPDGSAVLIFNLGGELRAERPRDTRRAFAEGQDFYSGASATYAHERSLKTPKDVGAATTGVFIYLDEVDTHYAIAKAAGAEIVHPPKDESYGRTYWANDPEGRPWLFTSPSNAG